MRLINRLLAWINEPELLGCPDLEMHDRNNENYDVLASAVHGNNTNFGTIN